MKRSASGFTIVELLIVIVVIAILAAIGVVAYSGIQNRANDVAVQADLANIGKKISSEVALNGTLPDIKDIGLKVSKKSYSEGYWNGSGYYNLLYCVNTADKTSFGLAAWSKSGNGFAFMNGGVKAVDWSPASWTIICPSPNLGISSWSGAWLYNSGTWVAWL